MIIFRTAVLIFCEALILLLFVRSMMSVAIRDPRNQSNNFIFQLTEPILAPLRRVLPKFGVADLSPFVAIVILTIVFLLISLIH